ALAGLSLRLSIEAANLAQLSPLVGGQLPSVRSARLEGRIGGTVGRPVLSQVSLRAGLAEGPQLTAQGGIDDVLGAGGLDLAIRLRGGDGKALSTLLDTAVPDLGAFDIAARLHGGFAAPMLDGLKGRFGGPRGTLVTVEGAIGEPLAGRGLDLRVALRAADLDRLAPLLGAALPSLPNFTAEGRITGSVRQPALADLSLRAGARPGLLLTGAGRVADAAAGTGLDLALRLRGDDGAALTRLLRAEFPAPGSFDIAARLAGSYTAPKVTEIDGRLRQPDGTDIRLAGDVARPLQGAGLALRLAASGEDLKSFAATQGLQLGDLKRFRMAGELKGAAAAPVLENLTLDANGAGGTSVRLSGRIAEPLAGQGADLRFQVDGSGATLAADLFAVDLVVPGKLVAEGRLRGGASAFRLDDLRLRGDIGDLSGRLDVALAGPRPALRAELTSRRLDFTQDSPSAAEQGEGEAPARMIPDLPIDLAPLTAFDGDIAFQGAEIHWQGLTFKDADLRARLRDGRLDLSTARAELADGRLSLAGALDGNDVPRADLRLTLDDAAFATLAQDLAEVDSVSGLLDLRADLRARGADLRTMVAGMAGDLSIVLSDGRIDNDFLDLLGKDLVLAVVKWWSTESGTRMNCFANGYRIGDGVAESRVLLLDAENATIVGQGRVDLTSEAIEFRLTPQPKNPGLIRVATPITVGGTLADPSFAPDPGAVAGGVARAVVGNLLLPGVGLILPLLDVGGGEKHPCLQVVKGRRAVAAPITEEKRKGIVGRIGGAVGKGAEALGKGAGALLEGAGKILGKE
ncbi:MAG: AsmA-like C-terminal region-containing protein, partial [Alphaproteobacteria bacterium]|nr:AsmA-like C-terminal region-containing protein [Alphaproteobacteria bacterium]